MTETGDRGQTSGHPIPGALTQPILGVRTKGSEGHTQGAFDPCSPQSRQLPSAPQTGQAPSPLLPHVLKVSPPDLRQAGSFSSSRGQITSHLLQEAPSPSFLMGSRLYSVLTVGYLYITHPCPHPCASYSLTFCLSPPLGSLSPPWHPQSLSKRLLHHFKHFMNEQSSGKGRECATGKLSEERAGVPAGAKGGQGCSGGQRVPRHWGKIES